MLFSEGRSAYAESGCVGLRPVVVRIGNGAGGAA